MEAALVMKPEKTISSEGLIESRIEALKALATLLLREVESLEVMPNFHNQHKNGDSINLSDELERIEVELIRDALIRAGGHQRRAAGLLGTKVTTLNAKMKRYHIESYGLVGKI